MENNIVTKEEAEARINENFETLQTAHGMVRFNKGFFTACACIGIVCTGIGIVGLATIGLGLAPIAATGLGVATIVTSGAFYRGENKEEKSIYEQADYNQTLLRKIEVKDITHQEAKETEKQKIKK